MTVLYGITLVPLSKDLRAADPGVLSSFYTDDAAFNSSTQKSVQLVKVLMKRGLERGYLPEPAKSLFILDMPMKKMAARREFVAEGLVLNFLSGSRYIGDYLCPQEGLEARIKPQVEAWAHKVRVLG